MTGARTRVLLLSAGDGVARGRGGSPRGGTTLLEVLVALAVLEVGLLAAAGTLVLAARELGEAERRERATGDLSALADSLLEVGGGGAGARIEGYATLAWERRGSGWRLIAHAGGDTLVEVAIPWAPP